MAISNSPVPVDRGWAWVVVMGAFMNLVILIGISKCLGMIFAEMLEIYQGTASGTSTMLALCTGLGLFIAPLVTTLSDMYTCRVVSIVGGIICCLGFLVPAFCNSLEQIVVSFGILTGIGYGVCLTPAAIIVGCYFERYRSLANGLMFSGSGVGGMIIPLFLNHIIHSYGLHGAMIILSGLALQTIVFSSFYRPLGYWKGNAQIATQLEDTQIQVDHVNSIHNDEYSELNQRRFSTTGLGHTNQNHHFRPHPSVTRLTDRMNSVQQDMKLSRAESKMTLYFSAMNLASWLSVPDIQYAAIPSMDNSTQTQEIDQKRSRFNWRSIFRRSCYVKAADGADLPLFDLRILKNMKFVLFIFSCMFMLTCVYIGMIIPPHCHEMGMSKSEVAWLLSIQGGADTTGRLLTGFIGDWPIIKRRRKAILAICYLVCAFSTFASIFLKTFWALAGYLVVCSLAIGFFVASTPVALVELVGTENLSRAWGLTMFTEGFSVTFSPLIIGALRDFTHAYTSGLIFLASCFTLAALCIFAILILECRQKQNMMHENGQDN